MKNRVVEARASGKIYVAGEYAVVLHRGAIIAPIDRYLSVKLSSSNDFFLKSHKYHHTYIKLDFSSNNKETIYVVQTLKWFERFLKELNRPLTPIKIEIKSQLDLTKVQKFGFGSSAAVTVALLKALFNYYEISCDEMMLYKASVMIQSDISKNTSFGDLACIAFNKVIFYRKFSEEVFNMFNNLPILDILSMTWPELEIQELEKKFEFLIIYTNRVASSFELVFQVLKFQGHLEFLEFLQKSEDLVITLKENKSNTIDIINELALNLKDLDQLTGGLLITQEMNEIENIVKRFNGSMKLSGSGGGDCVIAFFNTQSEMKQAQEEIIKQSYPTLIYPLKEGSIVNRKNDHIKYALSQDFIENDFDKVRFVHQAISPISLTEVNLNTSFCNINFPYPFFINAMTGGTEKAQEINDKLAKLAREFNLPIASGSLSIALKDPRVSNSFTILRQNHPDGIIMANLGADKTFSDALIAKDLLKADIMQIHLNQVQELIMPEGERDFKNWQENIADIVKNVNLPVIVKEVGFGMSRKTFEILKSLNVKTIDVSGKGGTNFAKIENLRRQTPMTYLNDWGLSTVESLLEASNFKDLEILASGGIRHPLDVAKALALGAKAVGMSSYFLKLVMNHSLSEAIEKVEQFILELKTIMALLGTKTIEKLKNTEIILEDSLLSFMKQRKIDEKILLNR